MPFSLFGSRVAGESSNCKILLYPSSIVSSVALGEIYATFCLSSSCLLSLLILSLLAKSMLLSVNHAIDSLITLGCAYTQLSLLHKPTMGSDWKIFTHQKQWGNPVTKHPRKKALHAQSYHPCLIHLCDLSNMSLCFHRERIHISGPFFIARYLVVGWNNSDDPKVMSNIHGLDLHDPIHFLAFSEPRGHFGMAT